MTGGEKDGAALRSGKEVLPYGLDGGAFAGEGGFVEAVAGFVEAGDVLGAAQGAVGVGSGLACAGGQQGGGFGALQQSDVAEVGFELRVLAGVGEHEVLHAEFGVDHAAGALFDVEHAGRRGVGGAHFVAHGGDFVAQGGPVAFGGDDGVAHGVKARGELGQAADVACAGHGLVFPGPGGVAAALLLVAGVGGKAGDEQAAVAVGAQGGVDFKEVAFAGAGGEPGDELAGKA